MYIYIYNIYIYTYIYICICIYMYICNHENNVITTMGLWQLMHLGITVRHVPKCMSCHKAIVVITGRAHCFHVSMITYIHITLILLL